MVPPIIKWSTRNLLASILLLPTCGLLTVRYCAIFAQTPQGETLRVNVDLTTVEVTVKDKKGQPIPGLKKEGFRLWVDGKEQEILTADEVILGVTAGKSAPGKVLLIVFDDKLTSLRPTREAAETLVTQHMRPGDLAAVVVHGAKARIGQNFTHETAKVIEANRKSAQNVQIGQPEFPGTATGGSVSGIDLTSHRSSPSELGPSQSGMLRTLSNLSSSMLRVKGRKAILVFYTSRTLTGAQYAQVDREARYRSEFDQELGKAVDASKQSPVPIYIIDQQKSGNWSDRLNQIDSELSNYYVLGFLPVGEERKDKARKIIVKTLSEGAKLTYQSALVELEPQTARAGSKVEQILQTALSSAVPLRQLPMTFRTAYFYFGRNRVRVGISAKIQASALKFNKEKGQLSCPLNVMGLVLAEDGSVSARFAETYNVVLESVEGSSARDSEVFYRGTIKLSPGSYRIRLAVSDRNARVGSEEQNLVIPALPVNQLAMSSLVVTQHIAPLPQLIQDIQSQLMQDDNPLIYKSFQIHIPADKQLNRLKPMVIFFKLYNLGSSSQEVPDLIAKIRLKDQKGFVRALPSIPLAPAATLTGERDVTVALNLPTSELLPGNYKMTIVATDQKTSQTVTGETDLDVK